MLALVVGWADPGTATLGVPEDRADVAGATAISILFLFPVCNGVAVHKGESGFRGLGAT